MDKFLYKTHKNLFVPIAGDTCAIVSASQNGILDLVKYLVETGADFRAGDDCPIRMASQNGHLEVVKYFIEMGADFQTCDNEPVRSASLWPPRRGQVPS